MAVPPKSAEPSSPAEARPAEGKPSDVKRVEKSPVGDGTTTAGAAAPPIVPGATPLPPPKPSGIGAPPAVPSVAPSGATTAFTPRQPPQDLDCPNRLKAGAVAAEPATIGPQPDPRCTVVQPVRLTGLTLGNGAKVDFPDKPTIACTTADVFTRYVRDLLVPLASGTFASPLSAVWTGPGLDCRSRDHIFGAKLSAHGQGLAIDIAQMKLADGRLIAVGNSSSPIELGFETAARAAGCGYFHTALGPGSDSYHRTHWHFDLEVRGAKGDSKFCQ